LQLPIKFKRPGYLYVPFALSPPHLGGRLAAVVIRLCQNIGKNLGAKNLTVKHSKISGAISDNNSTVDFNANISGTQQHVLNLCSVTDHPTCINLIRTLVHKRNKKLSYRRETARHPRTSFSARSLIVHFTEHRICCTTI